MSSDPRFPHDPHGTTAARNELEAARAALRRQTQRITSTSSATMRKVRERLAEVTRSTLNPGALYLYGAFSAANVETLRSSIGVPVVCASGIHDAQRLWMEHRPAIAVIDAANVDAAEVMMILPSAVRVVLWGAMETRRNETACLPRSASIFDVAVMCRVALEDVTTERRP